MGTLWQDLRFGLRSLIKNPGFTAVAVLTLALGTGVTSSIFSVFNAVLLSALPYDEPDQLVYIAGTNRTDTSVDEWPSSYLDFVDWERQNQTFEGIAVYNPPYAFNLTLEGETERVMGEMVSTDYFRLLRQTPVMGRAFEAADNVVQSPRQVMIVSYSMWQNRLGGDPNVVGRSYVLDSVSYEVIGVMGPGFNGITDEAQIWVPVVTAGSALGPFFLQGRMLRWLYVFGRMKPGVTIEQAQADMDAVTHALEEVNPEDKDVGARLKPLREQFFGGLKVALWSLLVGSVLVLLIAWTNIANLLLARASGRQHEVSIRSALGAGRGRLIRQLLTESLLLALIGCGLGLLLARWTTGLLLAASAVDLRSFVDTHVNGVVVAAMIGLSVLFGVLFGLAPALIASKVNLSEVLKEGGKSSAGGGRHLVQNSLIVAQVAVVMLVVVAAGLLNQGFRALRDLDLGFKPGEVVSLRMDLKGPQYLGLPGLQRKQREVRQFLDELSVVPGVKELVIAGSGIPTDDWNGAHFTVEDHKDDSEGNGLVVLPYHFITPGYFSMLSIPLLQGRDFDLVTDVPPLDVTQPGPPANVKMIVSEGMVKQFWPGQNAIGKRLCFGLPNPNTNWIEVVGVVPDVRHQGINGEPRPGPDVYLPMLILPPNVPPIINFLATPDGVSAEALIKALTQRAKEVVPTLPLYDPATLQQRIDRQLAQDRFLMRLMTGFALLALALAALGIYGVIAYNVSQRQREIGIRMALGSQQSDILKLVVGKGVRLALAGIALGVVGLVLIAYLAGDRITRVMSSLASVDPWMVAGGALVVLVVAIAASLRPARRATHIPPAITLRSE